MKNYKTNLLLVLSIFLFLFQTYNSAVSIVQSADETNVCAVFVFVCTDNDPLDESVLVTWTATIDGTDVPLTDDNNFQAVSIDVVIGATIMFKQNTFSAGSLQVTCKMDYPPAAGESPAAVQLETPITVTAAECLDYFNTDVFTLINYDSMYLNSNSYQVYEMTYLFGSSMPIKSNDINILSDQAGKTMGIKMKYNNDPEQEQLIFLEIPAYTETVYSENADICAISINEFIVPKYANYYSFEMNYDIDIYYDRRILQSYDYIKRDQDYFVEAEVDDQNINVKIIFNSEVLTQWYELYIEVQQFDQGGNKLNLKQASFIQFESLAPSDTPCGEKPLLTIENNSQCVITSINSDQSGDFSFVNFTPADDTLALTGVTSVALNEVVNKSFLIIQNGETGANVIRQNFHNQTCMITQQNYNQCEETTFTCYRNVEDTTLDFNWKVTKLDDDSDFTSFIVANNDNGFSSVLTVAADAFTSDLEYQISCGQDYSLLFVPQLCKKETTTTTTSSNSQKLSIFILILIALFL